MFGGLWFNVWWQGVEDVYYFVEVVGVFLSNFYGFQFFQVCFFGDFIFGIDFIVIVFKVAYIGDVVDIVYFVIQVYQIMVDDIEVGECMVVF